MWTTTPWTLASNMYAAVKPDVDYVVVQDDGRRLIVAARLRETIAGKLGRELPVVKELKGSDLLGLRYRPPFDDYYRVHGQKEVELREGGREPMFWKVLAAEFVELDQGTGLVHEAPAFGEVDHDLHRENLERYENPEEVPLLCAINPDGTFSDEIPMLSGQWVKDADKEIIRYLKEKGSLVYYETYRHEYPFCWRADKDPLIQYARPGWFIRTTALKDKAIQNNRAVNWLPEHIKEGRFGDFLTNNVDWALSRERYWGTPLNIWINDETGRMAAPASMDEILQKNPNAFEAYHKAKEKDPSLSEHLIVHKPWIDQVTWEEPGEPGVYRRIPEVIDAWFDSGSMPFAQWGFPHKGREEFLKTFPSDFITEAIDQTRGWFYSMLMISTLVFDGETWERLGIEPEVYPHPYKTCIVLGHVTDPEGKKESKSKGNYTPPEIIMDRVALDFAVVDGTELKVEPREGVALVAREDLQGLDLLPDALVKAYRPGKEDVSLDLRLAQSKRLSRRMLVLSEEDRRRLGVEPTSKGKKLTPMDVPRLPDVERVNLEDLKTPAPGADAFRWFFFASKPPWNPFRHSLGNVRALQKEFPLKLRNVYSFFTIYAAIDEFDPRTMKGRPVAERALLDRWILSELARVNARVIEFMDEYRAFDAARELSSFVDGLSNWYLRRSRQRFWQSEKDDDKLDAYATLYETLVTISKLAAPFVPFMTEELYQNLVRPWDENAPESVHLSDYPEPDTSRVNASLNEEMATVRDIVSLGLRVRTDHKLKVRQPLSKAEVVLSNPDLEERVGRYKELMMEELNVRDFEFYHGGEQHMVYSVKPNFRSLGPRLGNKMPLLKKALQQADGAALRQSLIETGKMEIPLNGEPFVLDMEEVEVTVQAKEGYAAAGDQVAVVVLTTALTPELVDEGIYRELLSRIQAIRKELELEYTQRIRLAIKGTERVQEIVEERREHFMREVLCVELVEQFEGWADAATREMEIEGEAVTITLINA